MKHFQTIASKVVLSVAGVMAGYGLHALAQDTTSEEPLFYSGTVSGTDGTPLEGSHALTVRLFGQETGGNPLCATPQLNVAVTAGRFRVQLPSGGGGCSDAVASNSAWTELTVDSDTLPRSRVGAVPFAVRAKSASVAESLVGDQAQTLATLKTTVDNLPPPVAPTTVGGTLSYRVITTPTDCLYRAGTNSTVCTCAAGELATSGGAWAGDGNVLTASRLDARPDDTSIAVADRVRAWSVTCKSAGTPATDVACAFVQTICLKTSI